VINAIAVWNTRYFERAEAKLTRQHIPLPEEVWQHLSPFQWSHIHLNGSYHFTGLALEGDFRPLREYQGPRASLSADSQSRETEAAVTREEEEASPPIQLSFFPEEE
jgi:hypothetical protein